MRTYVVYCNTPVLSYEYAMKRQTILIVDETQDHREILRHFLQVVGYRVIAVASSQEALVQARSEQPDLILAALSLPGQPAWETARALRDTPELAGTPILGTTVYTTLLTLSRVRAIGCNDFIAKPVDFDGLLYQIGRLMPPAFAPAA